MNAHQLLLIDDEERLRGLLARILTREGFNVAESGTARAALTWLAKHPCQLILCDVRLPDANGVQLVQQLKQACPDAEVILMTAYGNIEDGVSAIKNGAYDYLVKGDDNDRLIPLVHRALEKNRLEREVRKLQSRLQTPHSFDAVIGRSGAIQAAVASARKVAPTQATVLLTGETGTGKEVFAQAIHQASQRARHSFVAVNCAAFSKDLLENELFGHKAGAFTGAQKESAGIFEEANGGTVFLDEVGEMPLELQAKLLRVLESGEFLKIGDNKPSRVDVRVIAATNRHLPTAITHGLFREDLYYRLSVFQIQLPSLQDRTADIPLLADHFIQLFAQKNQKRLTGMSVNYLQALQAHVWKGNIRELRNVIERSVILSDGPLLEAATLPFDFLAEPTRHASTSLADAEKQHIEKVLRQAKGNKTETARLLGIALTTLYRKLEEYKLQ